MSRRSIKPRGESALRPAQAEQFEVVEPARSPRSGFSFSYTVTEVSMADGRTRVSSRSQRLRDGKLVSESFDAELDRAAYERMATQAAERFAGPLRSLLQPFSWLLPRDRRR
jgi:hypothetical protein